MDKILPKALEAINNAQSVAQLEEVRVALIGKKGSITNLLKELKNIPAEQKREYGQKINVIKQQVTEQLALQKSALINLEVNQKLQRETVDITLPGRRHAIGHRHPISISLQTICEIFAKFGFWVETGPEIESEYYNFSALNIPDDHPARAMHDTFYFDAQSLLRTHTSPVQIRAMEKLESPPLQIIAPGRVYRCDSDATHTPMFHQVEGLMVTKNVSFADLKGLLTKFIRLFFAKDLATRFRTSYFPFTEPSCEVDITCVNCMGKGCRLCKNTGWIEVLGCGMVHPNVLKSGNIDPAEYTGFAFGMGVERLTMLKYNIDDLRVLFDNDLRMLEQF